MSDVTGPIERQRLDRALESGRTADPATRAQIEAFEAMLRGRGRKSPPRRGSLSEEIDRLVMPEIDDPVIFNAGRSLDLLGHVIDTILPGLGADDDVAMIAEAVLTEEVDRRREIEERLLRAEGA